MCCRLTQKILLLVLLVTLAYHTYSTEFTNFHTATLQSYILNHVKVQNVRGILENKLNAGSTAWKYLQIFRNLFAYFMNFKSLSQIRKLDFCTCWCTAIYRVFFYLYEDYTVSYWINWNTGSCSNNVTNMNIFLIRLSCSQFPCKMTLAAFAIIRIQTFLF